MFYIHGSLLILQQLVASEHENSFLFLRGQNVHELFDLILRFSSNWASSSKASYHDHSPHYGIEVPSYASIVLSALGTLSNYLRACIERKSAVGSPASVVEHPQINDHGVSLSQLMILSLSKGLEPTASCFSLTLAASCIRHDIFNQSKVTYFRDVCAQLSDKMHSPRARLLYFLVDVFFSLYEAKDFVAIGGGTNRQSNLNLPLKELLEWILNSQSVPVEITNRAIRSIGMMAASQSKKLIAMASDNSSIKVIVSAMQCADPSMSCNDIACVALWTILHSNDKAVATAKSSGLESLISSALANICAAPQQSLTHAWSTTYERASFGIQRCLD